MMANLFGFFKAWFRVLRGEVVDEPLDTEFCKLDTPEEGTESNRIDTEFDCFREKQKEITKKFQTSTHNRVALRGMPRVGKTVLARQFAVELYRSKAVNKVWWVKAQWAETAGHWGFLAGIVEMAGAEGLNVMKVGNLTPSSDPKKLRKLEKDAWQAIGYINASSNWLLIFDNMDYYFSEMERYALIKKYFEALQGGMVLVTTRDDVSLGHVGHIEPVAVECLTPQQGAEFLLSHSDYESRLSASQREQHNLNDITAHLEKISQSRGGRLLLLDIVASNIREQEGDAVATYIAECAQRADTSAEYLESNDIDTYKDILDDAAKSGDDAKLAAELVQVCAFFAPDDIPLIENAKLPGHPAPDANALQRAARRGVKLHLFQHYNLESNTVSLHRSVRETMQLIVREKEAKAENEERQAQTEAREATQEKPTYLQDARQIMEDLLPATENSSGAGEDSLDVTSKYLLHLEQLAQSGKGETNDDFKQWRQLQNYNADFSLLASLNEGKELEGLLFGTGEEPTYNEMRWPEKEQKLVLIRRMKLLRHLRADKLDEARLIFACSYFTVYYWWDLYIADDNLSDSLLEPWRNILTDTDKDAADKAFVETLKNFEKAFPPLREYQKNSRGDLETRECWESAATLLRDVQQQLNITNHAFCKDATGPLASAKRFVRGVTNLLLADALFYEKDKQAPDYNPEHPEVIELLEQARELFDINEKDENYKYYLNWATWELARYHILIAESCKDKAAIPSAEVAYKRAKEECESKSGMELAIKHAEMAISHAEEEGEIDLEILANFILVQANLEAERGCSALQIMASHCAACYLAYVTVLRETDSYVIAFYGEQLEHAVDWLLLFSKTASEAEFKPLCEFALNFWWGASSETEEKWKSVCAALKCHDNSESALALRELLFLPAPKLDDKDFKTIASLVEDMPDRAEGLKSYLGQRNGNERVHFPEQFVELARGFKKEQKERKERESNSPSQN